MEKHLTRAGARWGQPKVEKQNDKLRKKNAEKSVSNSSTEKPFSCKIQNDGPIKENIFPVVVKSLNWTIWQDLIQFRVSRKARIPSHWASPSHEPRSRAFPETSFLRRKQNQCKCSHSSRKWKQTRAF